MDHKNNGPSPSGIEAASTGEPILQDPRRDQFLARLWDSIANPDRLMRRVGERPLWWQPGLLILGTVALVTWFTYPIAAIDGREQLQSKRTSWPYSEMSDDQWNQMLDKVGDSSPAIRLQTSVMAGFTMWIVAIVVGLVLGFFAKMAEGHGNAWQAIGIASWGHVPPFVFASIIRAPLVLITESSSEVSLGLAALVNVEHGGVLWKILNVYGDFSIWWCLALLVVGFARVFRLQLQVAMLTVVVPWLLLSLIVLGYQLVFM